MIIVIILISMMVVIIVALIRMHKPWCYFRRLPPEGYELMTDGKHYTYKDNEGHIRLSVKHTTRLGAMHAAWNSFELDKQWEAVKNVKWRKI